MSASGSIIPGAERLAKIPVLSKAARLRHKWFQYWETHGHNVSLTCRYFGISRQTFYYWKPRYERQGPRGLEDRSCRPRRVRQRSWSLELIGRVKALPEQYPRWGKDKLAVLLAREDIVCSVSMVGRILTHLKHTGGSGGHGAQATPACQTETQGVCGHAEVFSRAIATTASRFLGRLLERMPFTVWAIQVDGGSEFMAEFETARHEHDIQLFILPPRSPKLNGHVERTHTEEFWEVTEVGWTVTELQPELRAWETVYNTVRPHQSLGYQTPAQFLDSFVWKEPVRG